MKCLLKQSCVSFFFVLFTGEFNFIIPIRQLLFHLIELSGYSINKKSIEPDAFKVIIIGIRLNNSLPLVLTGSLFRKPFPLQDKYNTHFCLEVPVGILLPSVQNL